MKLRLARPTDAETIATYHVAAWAAAYTGLMPQEAIDELTLERRLAQWTEWLATPNAGMAVIVADVDGAAVGHAVIGGNELFQLYVDPGCIGEGYGRALLNAATRELRRRGNATAELTTLNVASQPAYQLYVANGWVPGVAEPSELCGGADSVRMSLDLSSIDVLAENRNYWAERSEFYGARADAQWSADTPFWGVFGVPDDGVGFLDGLDGKDVVELGCGTGYVSKWALAAGAASAVGIDNSPEQLATAAAMTEKHNTSLPLVWGDAERLPFANESFNVALSEYGAAIWCDPRVWIPEAARVLRPGGELRFLGNSVIAMLAVSDYEYEPVSAALKRPQRGMHRFDWPDSEGIEYHISHGEMIDILVGSGFEILGLKELYCDPEADTDYDFVNAEWASKWPVEDAWFARKRDSRDAATARRCRLTG